MGAPYHSRVRLFAGLGGAGLFLLLIVLYRVGSELEVLNHWTTYSLWQIQKPLYKLDLEWPKFSEEFTGQTFCVAVDHLQGLVYVGQFQLLLDAGKYGHTVKQYSPLGELLRVIGTPGTAGSDTDPLQFDQPAEVFVESTGNIYIVDGDGGLNNRLLKLTEDLKILWLRGENGTAPTQFRIPHSVTVDSVGRVWVADRANWRIQVFEKNTGEWLGSWENCFTEDGPYSVRFTPDQQYIIVAHLNVNKISILAAPPVGLIGNCIVVDTIQLAREVKPHLLDVSLRTGAIYVAEIGAEQVQKYVPLD
ncbi:NHL repeat-containing protein 3 isoform X2 [Ahaetulla prasina]|uniref:NHL repeat-containing protein 3 isoform X2 n=1 Tax=Ahaetulla prasina TaxID=499056 RepID=UPI00264759F9|nr:NHL repeat-containing protein 3 isoform X2 [Ahaetulla prasina]